MRPISESIKQNLSANIIGRIKLNLYKAITKQPNQLPDSRTLRHLLLNTYRNNQLEATILSHILSANSYIKIRHNDLTEPHELSKTLNSLEKKPLDGPLVLGLYAEDPNKEDLAVLLYCEQLADGGLVYVLVAITEDFPEKVHICTEIRASRSHPEPAFVVLSSSTPRVYSRITYKQSAESIFSTKILNYVQKNKLENKLRLIELKDIHKHKIDDASRSALEPPTDPNFERLIRLALLNRLACTETNLPLETIKSHDIDFCLSLPAQAIDVAKDFIRTGERPSLLVYWDGSKFITSDDHPVYLAYRSLGHATVPAVIMGPYPHSLGKPLRTGHSELIPPIATSRLPLVSPTSAEQKEHTLTEKLNNPQKSGPLTELYATFIGLSNLLQNPRTRERDLHQFILSHPTALDPFGTRMLSEVRLADKYRIDLVIQYNLNDRRTVLVELERSDLLLFTKKGRPCSHLTHATQQVEDWLQWWRENPTQVPSSLDSTIPVQGLVVIGRNKSLDESGRRRLLHLNSTRDVQIITYDDLLERLYNLICSLDSAAER